MDISKPAPGPTQGAFTRTMLSIVAAGLALAVLAALVMDRQPPAPDYASGVRVYNLGDLAEKCADVKPLLAEALGDDRVTTTEADGIEAEGRRLYRISSDARLHNSARHAAGLKPNPEPTECRLPSSIQP